MEKTITGKQFRKELKRLFKKYDLDDKRFDIISGYLMSFLVSQESYEDFMGDTKSCSEVCEKIDEWYKRPKYTLKYDRETNELYLEEKTENNRLK